MDSLPSRRSAQMMKSVEVVSMTTAIIQAKCGNSVSHSSRRATSGSHLGLGGGGGGSTLGAGSTLGGGGGGDSASEGEMGSSSWWPTVTCSQPLLSRCSSL